MPKSSTSRRSRSKTKATKSSAKTISASSTRKVAAELMSPEAVVLPEFKAETGHVSKHSVRRLSPAWEIARSSAQLLWQYRKPFSGIIVIYAVLNLLLVQGLANGVSVSSLKSQVAQSYSGHLGQFASGIAVFAYMVGSAGGSLNSGGGAYELFLLVIVSLAFIWAIKQVMSGVTFQIRDAYYRGMYPLVPVILVLVVIGLQLLPLLLAATLYNLLVNNSIVSGVFEIAIVGLVFAFVAGLTLYMLSASLLALYIATKPDMTPRLALRLARQLVKGRRWTVLRKILFLPLILVLAGAVIMVPSIILLSHLAPWMFFILTVLAVAAVHTYMYTLYRELAHEEA